MVSFTTTISGSDLPSHLPLRFSGALYNTSSKITARTTTQDRMLKSAEYFMAGFFGLEWTHNATLALILEQQGFNNSLAGYFQCNNSNSYQATGGNNASRIWENNYLANATKRLSAMSGGYNWTVADAYVCLIQSIVVPARQHRTVANTVSRIRTPKQCAPTRQWHL